MQRRSSGPPFRAQPGGWISHCQVQFLTWIGHVLHGDLGTSLWLQRPVLPPNPALNRSQATLLLAGFSLALSTVVGIVLGIVAAARQRSWLDQSSMLISLVGGLSAPTFWTGIILIVLFSLTLRWLPPAGMEQPGGGDPIDVLQHLILPGPRWAPSMAIVARLTRASMLDVIRQENPSASARACASGWFSVATP